MNLRDILRKIFTSNKSCSLSTFIHNKIKGGQLFEHRLPFMYVLGRDISFYKTDISYKNEWLSFLNNKNDIEVINGYKSIIIIHDSSIITILFEWNGLYDLINLFEKFKDSSTSRKLFIAKYDIDKCLGYLSERFSEVVKEFDGLVIKGETIEIYNTITPDKAVIKNKILKIPEDERIPITRICIYTDPSCMITSVRLHGKHPNADSNGWYCLGNLKFIPLSVESIKKLIENIKCYKLQDCYWKPKNYNEWDSI